MELMTGFILGVCAMVIVFALAELLQAINDRLTENKPGFKAQYHMIKRKKRKKNESI